MINNIKLKYDSIVYHNVYGLGNIRGQITDNNKRMVKFKNTSTTNEIELNDLTIPHQINTSIYYDNEMFNIMDIYIENGILQYKIINSCESKNININDKNIHKKFKKTKEVKINQFFETIQPDLESKLTVINNTVTSNTITSNTITSNNTTIIEGPISKLKYATLLTQKYNKIIEKLNKNSHEEPFKNISITQFNKIITTCKLSYNQIDKIIQTIETTQDHSLEIMNIICKPFDFIREDIQLITYEKADKICIENVIDITFTEKCIKWAFDLFKKLNTFYIESGNFYWHFKNFCKLNSLNYLLYIDIINNNISDKIINRYHYKTTKFLLNYEKNMTDLTMDLFHDKMYNISNDHIINGIDAFEIMEGIKLTEEQINAIIKSINNKINIILGFPGTGKSTIVKCILFILNIIQSIDDKDEEDYESDCECEGITFIKKSKYPNYNNISILGPTGLSYIGLASKCGHSIQKYNKLISGTCHRVIYNIFPKIKCILENSTIDIDENLINIKPDLLIIDEFSMIDSFMFNDILEWCKYFDCRLILLGDENQLPSIGPGIVLDCLIKSNIFSEIKLTEIKRNSGSLMNNIKKMSIEKLKINDFIDDSCIFLDIDEFITEDGLDFYTISQLISKYNFTKDNSKFLSYFKNTKYTCNIINLNNIIQSLFNPDGMSFPSKSKFENRFIFKQGDIIIRIENDYKNGDIRANGEHAVILYKTGFNTVAIKYMEDDKIVSIDMETLYSEFILAYALTVHKSQGSQYDNVIIFIDKDQIIWDKKALYTAISRAKLRCIIIGKMSDFLKIQDNMSSDKNSLFMKDSDNYEFV